MEVRFLPRGPENTKMTEHDLGGSVAELNENVKYIRRRVGGSGMALWRGIMSGFGYVIGAFVAVLLIGWVLNALGVIPSFKAQIDSLKSSLQQVQQRQIPSTK